MNKLYIALGLMGFVIICLVIYYAKRSMKLISQLHKNRILTYYPSNSIFLVLNEELWVIALYEKYVQYVVVSWGLKTTSELIYLNDMKATYPYERHITIRRKSDNFILEIQFENNETFSKWYSFLEDSKPIIQKTINNNGDNNVSEIN